MDVDVTWSLNRVHIADLPGLEIPTAIKGKTGYELVSAARLTELIRQHSAALQVDADLDDHAQRMAFDGCLESENPSVRKAAEHIARGFGRDMGYLLLTLRRGDAVNRKARPEWDDAHWAHWEGIRQVWLGGGLVSGRLGRHITAHASQVMREGGFQDYAIRVSPYGADLPLIGAARQVPPGADAVALLDFGSTHIKRAWADYQAEQLAALGRLGGLPVPWASVRTLDETTPAQVAGLIGDMASIIAGTYRALRGMGIVPGETIPVCVAAYVKDGNPLLTQAGIYMQTNLVTGDLEGELSRRVSAQLGSAARVKLLHDGTAAATAYAGQTHTAVITLGTALGIGFPGAAAGLRAIHPDLKAHYPTRRGASETPTQVA